MSLRVTAVVVSHDGEAYLPRTLAALRAQSRPLDFTVGVDTGSRDSSSELLEQNVDQVVGVPRTTAFGAAVARAIESLPPVEDAAREWLWLIHDDSAPDVHALEQLLIAVDLAPSVAVVGCKQLDWDDPKLLRDVGLTTSRWGRRMTLLSPGEVDQGQYDSRSDVLAVNSAGMLIRRDVWDALGGLDHNLRLFHDDIDLCKRARLAGHRVEVVPNARMFHAEAASNGLRSGGALDHSVMRTERRNMIFSRLVHAPAFLLPFHIVISLLSGLGLALFRIAAKEPGSAGREIGGSIDAVIRPGRLATSRRRARRTRSAPRSSLSALYAEPRDVWRTIRENMATAPIARDADPDASTSHQETYVHDSSATAGDTSGVVEEFSPLDTLGAPRRRIWTHPAVLTVFALAILGVLALFRLIGEGHVVGGALKEATLTLGQLNWSAVSNWNIAGLGHPAAADPFLAALVPLSLLAGGSPSVAVTALLVCALPLAGLGAWVAAGCVTGSRGVRSWTALVWAAMPPLTLAINEGRLGAILAHVLLPWCVLGMVRAIGAARAWRYTGRPGTSGIPSWSAAAAGGLALAGVSAGAPALLPAIAVLVVVLAIAAPKGRKKTVPWLLIPSLALFGPYLVELVRNPRLIAADPGALLASTPAPAWQQVLLQPVQVAPWPWLDALLGGLGEIVPIVVWAPVVLVAILALLRSGSVARGIRLSWFAVLLGLATAIVSGQIAVGSTADQLVASWPGSGVSLLGGGLLAASVAGSLNLRRRLSAPRISRTLRPAVAVLAVLAVLGPLTAIGVWTGQNLTQAAPDSKLTRTAGLAIPAVAGDQGLGSDRTRTLMLSHVDGELTGQLLRADGQTIASTSAVVNARSVSGAPGQQKAAGLDDAQAQLGAAIAAVTAGSGGDPRPVMSGLGIGFVVLSDAMSEPRGVNAPPRGIEPAEKVAAEQEFGSLNDSISAAIDTCAGLTRVGNTSVGLLWRVEPGTSGDDAQGAAPDRPARVRILDSDGRQLGVVASKAVTVDARVPDAESPRTIVLAERADDGWRAWLNGKELAAGSDGWAQSFELPADGGDLVIKHSPRFGWLWPIGQGIVLLLAVLLAIPLPGRRRAPAGGSGTRIRSTTPVPVTAGGDES
ncbi:glycosyltransferase family 2 protein [Saxibacter everestensis]|uniref:Glycosyltransferase family 2 protein n=1 Tax=Saxibacter everestensis TaxID=2909229 RepID=A0ABY8QP25_9MICO|nr:glycosyltransferase family 2 protein [Brevibacteriaceae bacterium ZFBP1038]